VAQWATGAKVVKTFNSVGANVMADPALGTGKVAMLYCGDDADAKTTVAGLIDDLGFESIDFGPLARASSLEHFALLWITLAYPCGFGHDFAFEVVRRGNKHQQVS
jgi:predicted dinucleotide-binding enzyme